MKNQVHLIMPMGGAGSRFKKAGFDLPKPLIEIHGKPFFFWSTMSIVKDISVADITFVVLEEHIKKFSIDQAIKSYFPSAKLVIIPEQLNGAVLTALEGVKQIQDSRPLMFNDCDHAFRCHDFATFCNDDSLKNNVDGALLTFRANDPKYSYLILDSNNQVKGTIEKQVASSHAICGVYYFANRETFETAASAYLESCKYQEFFLSGVYNEMTSADKHIAFFECENHVSFGTPEEYELAVREPIFKELDR